MDNDRKVNQLVEHSKSVFLRSLLRHYQEDHQPYNLETEFAKSRRNRSLVIPLTLAIVIVVLGAILVGVTYFVRARTDQIQIVDSELGRVTVNERLDEVKRVESQVRALELERSELLRAHALELQFIDDQEQQALILVRSDPQQATQIERGLAQAQAQARRLRQEVSDRFAVQVATVEGQIAVLQQMLDESISGETESVLAQQQIFNPQRQLLELELSGQSNYFMENIATINRSYTDALSAQRRTLSQVEQNLILKYNPIYSDSSSEQAIRNQVTTDVSLAPIEPETDDFFPELLSIQEWRTLTDIARSEQALLDRLLAEPYTNSIPNMLQAIRSSGNFIFNRFSDVWSNTLSLLRDRTELLNQYEAAFENLALFNGDSGHIIDVDNSNAINVYIIESVNITPTTEAWVLRADEVLSLIRFRFTDEGLPVGYIVESFSDTPLSPFDRVLVVGGRLETE